MNLKGVKYRLSLTITVLSVFSYGLSTAQAESLARPMQIEEVVVSVQHKQEPLSDAPASVALLSGESLEAVFSSGEDIRVLASQVPGLYIESSNGRIAPRFYMRGLGNIDFDLAASQPVSVVFDDVVQENVVLKSFPLFDIDRIEVIRGPQGTLFGRNTTAGIVKVATKKPTRETEGFVKGGYGTYDSVNIEAAIGGALTPESLSGRLSVLSQQRDDWIDNIYKQESNAFGGHDELAARVQLLYEPTGSFSALFNYHTRDLDGSQTAFRANVFTQGSNDLNANYDRGKVFYDEGDNNTQQYKGSGSSLTLTWDAGAVELVSISGYEEASGSNTGDIDGGVAGVGPGFIPFSSATVDSGDIEQLTQEIRLRKLDAQFWEWQVGAFYFDSDVSVLTDAGFNVATVDHDNTSWAVFAHNIFSINPRLKLGVGLRFTDDEKTFKSAGLETINVSDDQWNGDLSLNYAVTEDVSLYTRIADGYRAPSIQGRDVAFFGQPSVAGSESILSYEAGIKTDLMDNKLRLNAAVFYYTIDGFQLSAIGGASNSNRLLNADEGVGQGFEVDLEAVPTANIKVTAGFSYNDTEIRDSALHTAVCGSGQCTPIDPLDANGNANINGNPFPGAPETTFNLTFRYQALVGKSGLWYIFTDWIYQGETNLALYESKEFVTDSQYEGGLRIGYQDLVINYDIAVFARNITDEDNVKGFVDFNNNTGFVNEPRIVGIEAKYSF